MVVNVFVKMARMDKRIDALWRVMGREEERSRRDRYKEKGRVQANTDGEI